MSFSFEELVHVLAIEEPVSYENIVLFPLRVRKHVEIDYLMLEDAQAQNLAEVQEVSEQGSIPTLRLVNH